MCAVTKVANASRLVTMVGHLFQNYDTIYLRFLDPRILAIIPATRYTRVFLPRILAFFPAVWGFYSQVYHHFLTNAHIYANKKSPYLSLRGRRKKGRERGREKSTKEGKGKGAPAIRAGVFVIRPPFSQLMDSSVETPPPPPPHPGPMWGNVGDFYGIWRHG